MASCHNRVINCQSWMHSQNIPDSTPVFSKWESEAQRRGAPGSRLHRERGQLDGLAVLTASFALLLNNFEM